ncbi:MAG: hypothetical protein ABSA70_02720 [Terriglobia bacterium]
MRLKIIFTFLVVFALAAAASAQTKISGAQTCAKADVEYSIQVGDRPNHAFVISQAKCTWTKPWEIAGIQGKEGIATGFSEISGDTSRYRGSYVQTMANGDKVHYRYDGTATLKDGVPQSAELKWTLVGGTGKLKGIKGKGTNKLKAAAADGSSTWDCEGEYELPK